MTLTSSTTSGATVSFDQPSPTGNTATMTVNVPAATTAGNHTIIVRGNAAGQSEQTATLNLTVTASGFTLSVSAPSVNATSGGAAATATVTINRTGAFTAPVNLTVAAPAGVTASFNPASVSGTSSVLTLTAAASAAAGTTPLTIRGNATGQVEQTVALNLVVGSGSGNIAWTFCGAPTSFGPSGLPLMVAAQDGTGAWTAVTGVNNVYTFQISSGRGGVAYVIPSPNGGFDTETFYGTTSELQAVGSSKCTQGGAGKTVNGTVAGTTAGDIVNIAMGRSTASPAGGATAFTLANVAPGSLDLIAVRSAVNLQNFTFAPNSILLLRNQNIAAGGSVGTLNFANGVAPATAALTVNNAGSDQVVIGAQYYTANGTIATLYGGLGGGTWYGVPAASQVAGDIHVVFASASGAGATPPTRSVLLASTAVQPLTISLLGPVPTPTVSVLASAPFVRLRMAGTASGQYNKLFTGNFQQATGTAGERLATIYMTANYFGSSVSVSLDFPDLTGVAGWLNSYGLQAGAATTWQHIAQGWAGADLYAANPFVNGAQYFNASVAGTITP